MILFWKRLFDIVRQTYLGENSNHQKVRKSENCTTLHNWIYVNVYFSAMIEAAIRICSLKWVLLEFPFNEVAGLKTCSFIKKRLQHRCFPVNIAKCLKTVFL